MTKKEQEFFRFGIKNPDGFTLSYIYTKSWYYRETNKQTKRSIECVDFGKSHESWTFTVNLLI